MTRAQPAPVLDAALEAHFLELDLLWEQRESQLFSDLWSLYDLAEIEERADAHVDGLFLAAAPGRKLARAGLTSGETGAACAGALVLLASDEADTVLAALAAAEVEPAVALGIRSALRHGKPSFEEARLREIGASSSALAAACVADVLGFRQNKLPENVLELARSSERWVQRLALAALSRSRAPISLESLAPGLGSDDPDVVFEALRAAAVTRAPGLAEHCLELAATERPGRHQALEMVGRFARASDGPFLAEQLASPDPERARAGAIALGIAGHPTGVPALLDALARDDVAADASAALLRILGSGLEARRVSGDDFAPDVESLEPAAASAHWSKVRGRLRPEVRYFGGEPLPSSPDERFDLLPLSVRRDLWLGACERGDARFASLELEARAVLQRQPRRALTG